MEKSRKIIKLIWACLWLVWLLLVIQPESRGILRLAVIAIFTTQLGVGLILFWKHRKVRYSIMTGITLLLLGLALPGRTVDSASLRDTYIKSLTPYEGTTYHWGGENIIGIDCSGLVRKGFIRANMSQGIQTLNGTQIREACSLWWFDASAKAMRDEYRGKTTRLFEAANINSLDHTRLLPGDFAVTRNGVHTLVYVGNSTWMQACPDRGVAQYEQIPVTDSTWFDTPIHILRWEILSENSNNTKT